MSWKRSAQARYLERVSDVPGAERRLLQMVDATFRRARELAGDWLACKSGCSECCTRPFPINSLDARRLRTGLAALAQQDPVRAAAIQARAVNAREELRGGFPGEPRRGALNGDRDAEERFSQRHEGVPCPALHPDEGTCELYEHRPVICRSYGPPVRFGKESPPPCRLCFDGAAPEEIERCRVTPDPDDLEDRILRSLTGDDPAEEPFIAFVLAEPL